MTTAALELINVTKTFHKEREKVTAVDSVNLIVNQGEMVVFLGPSGCGKTTTLRMIAGFELPSSGKILIEGSDMTNVPVNKRGIGFVFQNYALFPHMNVYNNVAYGLRSRNERESTIKVKVKNALDLVGLTNEEGRFPNQLSGGEQQRVALARVLVMEPKLLLMDEPLSNLDAKLRIYMRTELRRIQKKLGITCLYVTHDQSEALTMADRIMVMNKGHVEQIGTPFDIYAQPSSLFVADFIGQANILEVIVESIEGNFALVSIPDGWHYKARIIDPSRIRSGSKASLIVRPENIRVRKRQIERIDDIACEPKTENIQAIVNSTVFMGGHIEYQLDLGSRGKLLAFEPFRPGSDIYQEGDNVCAIIDKDMALLLPGN